MQIVDGDEDAVVVFVNEFDHLLRGAVDAGAQQAAELAHAMVDMHDVVARLDARKFFEREGQTPRASAVAAERIFVEAVENLVVGEEAELQGVVGETLVQGGLGGGEGYVFAPLLEDGLEAEGLLGRVG